MTSASGQVDIPSMPCLGFLSRKASAAAKEILQWAKWEPGTQSHNSILLVGIWWTVCLGIWVWTIYVLPLLPILLVARSWSSSAAASSSKQQKTTSSNGLFDKSVTSEQQFDSILKVLVSVEDLLHSMVALVQWSNNPVKTRRTFLKLVYVYFLWITAHQLFDTRYIMLVIGTIALTWQSPWIVVFRESIQYPLIKSVFAALFLGSLETDEDKKDGIMRRALKFQSETLRAAETEQKFGRSEFTFVIYENQRLWPFGQWESKTLPVERAPWSDDANESVPNKANFALPDAMQATVVDHSRHDVEYKKTWSWRWLDSEWQLNFDGNVDELGWEYGTIVWTMFDRYPKGFMSVRRRRWSRNAELDYRVVAVHKQINGEPTSDIAAVSNVSKRTSHNVGPLQSPTTTTTTTTTCNSVTATENIRNDNTGNNKDNSQPSSPVPSSIGSIASLPRLNTSRSTTVAPATPPIVSPRSPDGVQRGSTIDFPSSPAPRPSQSTATINSSGQSAGTESFRRRRGNSFAQSNGYTNSMYASSIVSEDWNESMASLDKRASIQSRDTIGSKKRREAVWKSIVRN